jgi:small GTP-binding protein
MSEKKIKVVLIGESGVGKTNLIRVAIGESFESHTESTLSSSFFESEIIYKNKKYKYSLWDTAGQEVYRSLNKIFIMDSKIVIVVFAINNKKSYEQVDFWINYAKEILTEGNYIMALVGNKSDLYEEQQISDEEMIKKAEDNKIKFKLTSAREDPVGFTGFLEELLKDFINNIGFKKSENEKNITLEDKKDEEMNENGDNDEKKKNKKKKCC